MTRYAIGDRVRRPDFPLQAGTIAELVGDTYYGIQMDQDRPGVHWYAGASEIEPDPLPAIGDRVLVAAAPFGERPGTLVEVTPDAIVGEGPTLWVLLDPTFDDLVAGIDDEDLAEQIPFRPEQVRSA